VFRSASKLPLVDTTNVFELIAGLQMKIEILKEHKSNYPNPIIFGIGELVSLGKVDSDNSGWIRVTTKDGNEGWAPIDYFESAEEGSTGRAICDYTAIELDVSPGEVLQVVKELSDWCWCMNRECKFGWVPANAGIILD